MTPAELDGRRILVMPYGHLADVLAAVPALRALRHGLPAARIEVLALEAVAPLLGPCPYVDELITWHDFRHKGARVARAEKAALIAGLAARLRLRRYDAVVLLHRSSRPMRTLARLIGARVTVGRSDGGDGFSHPVTVDGEVVGSRDENRAVLAALGLEDDGGPPEMWTAPDDVAAVDAILGPGTGGPLVALHPGSDWSCQQWLPDRLGAVGATLQARAGARIVVTGSPGEAGLAAEVAAGLPGEAVVAAGRTTVPQLIEMVRRLDLLVAVNSAPAAIADALGTPSVVLLGPEDARLTGVVAGERRRVVQPSAALAPGGWCELGRWGVLSGCESPICRGHGGLGQLEAEAVIDASIDLLQSTFPRREPPAPRAAGRSRP